MAKTAQLFFDNKWLPISEGYEAFQTAKSEGFPIRILHDNGSYKVIANAAKLPYNEPVRWKNIWERN